jgi:hypothetical protein
MYESLNLTGCTAILVTRTATIWTTPAIVVTTDLTRASNRLIGIINIDIEIHEGGLTDRTRRCKLKNNHIRVFLGPRIGDTLVGI